MKPKDARTEADVCKLSTDGHATSRSWISWDGMKIVIYNQREGEPHIGRVQLSRREFEAFIRWWNTDQRT